MKAVEPESPRPAVRARARSGSGRNDLCHLIRDSLPSMQQPFRAGVIELPANAQLTDLRNALSEEDWKPGFRICRNPECKPVMKYVSLERVILLD